MAVQENLRPTYNKKTFQALRAKREVNRITFKKTEANPGDELDVRVPRLHENEVLVPGSLALVFDINISGGHTNNILVQNVTRALVERFQVKFGGTTLQDTDKYGLYKTFEDLFLSQEERDGMILEGIQSEDLCKMRSGAGDKKTSSVDAENALHGVFGSRYRIRLDNQLITDNGVFYPTALYNDLEFIITFAKAKDVVRGSDSTQLKYKLKNIKLEYEMIHSKTLAEEAVSVYTSGKEFAYDYAQHYTKVNFKKDTDTFLNIEFNAQIRSLKALLLLFIEPHAAGARDSEKFIFPDLTKVSVMDNGSPNMLYNNGIEDIDMWREASRMFAKEKNGTDHMDKTKFYTGDKFGLYD